MKRKSLKRMRRKRFAFKETAYVYLKKICEVALRYFYGT